MVGPIPVGVGKLAKVDVTVGSADPPAGVGGQAAGSDATTAALRRLGDGAGAGMVPTTAGGSEAGVSSVRIGDVGATDAGRGATVAIGTMSVGDAPVGIMGGATGTAFATMVVDAMGPVGVTGDAPGHGSVAIAGRAAGIPVDTSAPTGSVAFINAPRNDGDVRGVTGGAAGVAATIVPNSPPAGVAIASPVGAVAPGGAKIAAKGSVAADVIMRVSGAAAASPPASL
ncbi:hypothetical protein GCM10022268_07120 [Sphingomonas cynarae]|uniref:Uncharacterized protein n=1 Tax=Sphingomonas cynarae TaxID=930197 RepID=A0ABP7D1Q8_9SPHN